MMVLSKGYEDDIRELEEKIKGLQNCLKMVQEEIGMIAEMRKKGFVFFILFHNKL